VIVDEGGLSLLEDGTIFDGCFKREAFIVGVVIVRLGSCETLLLLVFVRLPFVVGGFFVTFEVVGRVGTLL
jgi:hypothetical protein